MSVRTIFFGVSLLFLLSSCDDFEFENVVVPVKDTTAPMTRLGFSFDGAREIHKNSFRQEVSSSKAVFVYSIGYDEGGLFSVEHGHEVVMLCERADAPKKKETFKKKWQVMSRSIKAGGGQTKPDGPELGDKPPSETETVQVHLTLAPLSSSLDARIPVGGSAKNGFFVVTTVVLSDFGSACPEGFSPREAEYRWSARAEDMHHNVTMGTSVGTLFASFPVE